MLYNIFCTIGCGYMSVLTLFELKPLLDGQKPVKHLRPSLKFEAVLQAALLVLLLPGASYIILQCSALYRISWWRPYHSQQGF